MKTTPTQNVFRILLGLIMVTLGTGHLTFLREDFKAQVPRWLTNDPALMDFIVLSSGGVEISLGSALLFLVKCKAKVGLVLAVFYILIFPGNISQYTHGISAFGLDTDRKRLIRLFFQPFLVLWALWSTNALKMFTNRK